MAFLEATLRNEFAAVSVVVDTSDAPRIKITDLNTGVVAELESSGAFTTPDPNVAGTPVQVKVEADYAANGPRLKMMDVAGGSILYLDPLQLADAAVTGEWGRFPDIYNL